MESEQHDDEVPTLSRLEVEAGYRSNERHVTRWEVPPMRQDQVRALCSLARLPSTESRATTPDRDPQRPTGPTRA